MSYHLLGSSLGCKPTGTFLVPSCQLGMCVPITSTPPIPQVRHRSIGVPNEFFLPLVEFSSTSGGCILIGCLDRDQAQPATQEGALFVSGARACARSSGHACTTRASHAARCTPTRALTRAHCCPFDRASCARSIPTASLTPRRSFLCKMLVPERHSCRRLSIPTAPTAHAGAVRFFRIVRSAVRFCHGAFWEQ